MKRFSALFISFVLLCSIFSSSPSFAAETTEPKIHVKLLNYIGNQTQLNVKVRGEFVNADKSIRLSDQKTYIVKASNGQISLFDNGIAITTANTLELLPVHHTDHLIINDRPYLGSFQFVAESGKFVRPINTVYLEDYLKGVVPYEMPADWNKEALKAQAVAARTYAAGYASKVIDDTINYQVYGGYSWHANSTAAVEETSGEVLKINGRYISTVFSASNGGKTESNGNAWGNAPVPYLPIKEDPYDSKTAWQFTIKKQQMNLSALDLKNPSAWWNQTKEADSSITAAMKNWLSQNGYAGKDIKIAAVPLLTLHTPTSGGRVSKGSIKIEFFIKDTVDENGSLVLQTAEYTNIPASSIRKMIGNRVMKSYLIIKTAAANESIAVSGLGDGHGVGLSQWGAKNRADAGQKYADILSFYYEGASLVKAYSSRKQDLASALPAVQEPAPAAVPDKKAPSISQVNVTVNPTEKKAAVSFKIDETAHITVYIKDKQGKIITYLLKDAAVKAGAIQKQQDISKLPNGTYHAGIVAIDGSNNRSSVLPSFTIKHPVPAPAVKSKTGKVTATKLNVRASASIKSKVIGSLKKHQTVTIISTSGAWHKIQYGKQAGYVSKSYIK